MIRTRSAHGTQRIGSATGGKQAFSSPLAPAALRRTLAALLLLGLASSAFAARQFPGPTISAQSVKSLRSLSLEQLANVEVTTYGKTPTELWDTPAAVYVLTGQDIVRSGATTVADALRLVPGVEVGRMASNWWAVGIRGLQNNFSKSVLVLVDGRSVYTPVFAGTYWDVLDLPIRDIDHIEVIRGPGGTIWGPNAANGVINIVTKSAADTHGVLASGLGGTLDHTVDTLQYGSATHGIDFRIFGRGFQRSHEYHSDGLNDDNWHQERAGFRADSVSGSNTWFLEGQAYRGDSPRILTTTPYDDETSGGDLNFRWERGETEGNGLYLQAYFDRTLRTHDPIGESRNTVDVDFLQHFRIANRNQLSYGGGIRWSPYHILSVDPFDTILPARNTDRIGTAFIQDEFDLRSNLKVTGGLKLEDNNYSGLDLQPSGRVLWLLQPHQALWGGITRAVTTPSDLEEGQYIYAAAPGFALSLMGNRNFKSEDIVGYEAGYRGLFGDRLYLDVSTFWNQYSNLQSFSSSTTTSGGTTTLAIQYANQISGSTSGFEIAPQLSIVHGWRVNMGYSYLNSDFSAAGVAVNVSSSGSVDTYEHSTPKHMVFAQSLIDLPGRIHFDQTFRYNAALPAQKVPAYETMDLHLAKYLGRHFVLEAVGQNLLQPHHLEWGTGDPTQNDVGIDRSAYASLTFHSAPLP